MNASLPGAARREERWLIKGKVAIGWLRSQLLIFSRKWLQHNCRSRRPLSLPKRHINFPLTQNTVEFCNQSIA
jgi:hypothetical protein